MCVTRSVFAPSLKVALDSFQPSDFLLAIGSSPMPKITHVVLSKGRPESVDRVRELVGVGVFTDL